MHRIFGHRKFSADNGLKVHFRFSAERLLSPKQYGRNVVMTQTETATCTCLSEATCLRCGRISVYLRKTHGQRFAKHVMPKFQEGVHLQRLSPRRV